MKQTRRQRAASLRNLRKARSRRGSPPRRRRRRSNNPRSSPRRRRTRARRRNASSMPVVLVNPSPKRRRSRANPARRRRRTKSRRHRIRAHTRRYPRMRNPTGSWGAAFVAWLLGSTGGAVAAGMDWGADYLPWPAWAQALTLGTAGTLSSIAVCKWADVRAGCGLAGGSAALTLNRVRQVIALARTAPPAGTSATTSDASAVVHGQAGIVRPNAGQMVKRRDAQTMKAPALGGASYKQQAAAPTYPAMGTRFGPTSWVYGQQASAVYVSAHNRRSR